MPSYHTIANFRTFQRRDATDKTKILCCHRKALKAVFRHFVTFCGRLKLIGKETVAVDGTKIAAQNSKKRHLSKEKIERKIDRIDRRIDEYFEELERHDASIEDDPADLKAHKPEAYAALLTLCELDICREDLERQQTILQKATADDPATTQICLTDPDARMLPINNEGMMQIAYNVQSVVDDKHCLIVDFSVENQKDLYLLAPMAQSAKEALGMAAGDNLDMLADKGYHSGKGIQECTDTGTTPYVAVPEQAYKDRPKGFQKADFVYNAQTDTYTCPADKTLSTLGTTHEKKGRRGQVQANFKLYRCPFSVCSACRFKDKCLSKTSIENRSGRIIERSEYEEAAQANRQRMLLNRDKYKRRQAIVEHPFGTIKRSWGGYYTLLRTKEKVTGEMAILFTAYNLRRLMTILGVKGLINALKTDFWGFLAPSGSTKPLSMVARQVALWRATTKYVNIKSCNLKAA